MQNFADYQCASTACHANLKSCPWLNLEKLRQEFGLGDACTVVFGNERGAQIYDAIILAGAPD